MKGIVHPCLLTSRILPTNWWVLGAAGVVVCLIIVFAVVTGIRGDRERRPN